MEVEVLDHIPSEWKSKKGKTYETQYFYTGFRRYDRERQVYSQLEKKGKNCLYTEIPCKEDVFSRCYHVELVRVTVYSETPRVWAEERSSEEVYFFRAMPQQTDCT